MKFTLAVFVMLLAGSNAGYTAIRERRVRDASKGCELLLNERWGLDSLEVDDLIHRPNMKDLKGNNLNQLSTWASGHGFKKMLNIGCEVCSKGRQGWCKAYAAQVKEYIQLKMIGEGQWYGFLWKNRVCRKSTNKQGVLGQDDGKITCTEDKKDFPFVEKMFKRYIRGQRFLGYSNEDKLGSVPAVVTQVVTSMRMGVDTKAAPVTQSTGSDGYQTALIVGLCVASAFITAGSIYACRRLGEKSLELPGEGQNVAL